MKKNILARGAALGISIFVIGEICAQFYSPLRWFFNIFSRIILSFGCGLVKICPVLSKHSALLALLLDLICWVCIAILLLHAIEKRKSSPA